MSHRSYFIPTNSTLLPIYFGSGIIMPSGYYKGFLNAFQNISNGALIISEDKWLPGSNCSLEIVLTPDEKEKLIAASEQSGLFTLDTGLPISRVMHIFFWNDNQMENTIWNTDNGAAFIPNRIVSSKNTSDVALHSTKINIGIKNTLLADDLLKKAKQFDILLGGFAFMKVAIDRDINFPHNYFSTLAYFNSLIAEQVKFAEKSEKLDFNYNYAGLFTENSEWQYWKPFIFKEIKERDLDEVALNQGIKLEKKLGQIKLDSIDINSVFYDLVLLNTYGDNKKKGLEDLFSFFEKADISVEKKEEIALLFGVHIGYSKLRKSYQVHGKPVTTKFTLESQLDYVTIESLYQYVFNNNTNKTREIRDLDYLQPVLPEFKDEIIKTKFTTYRILDITVISKKREVVPEGVSTTYSNFFKAIANEICSWTNASPIFKADIKMAQEFLEQKFGPSLEELIATNKIKPVDESTSLISNASPVATVAKTVEEVICNDTAQLPIANDEFDRLNFTELKTRAKKNGIKISAKIHGSTTEMEELKRILRNTPSIL